MILDLTIADKIKQLHREGLRPSERLVNTITRAGAAAFTPLLELAIDVELLHEEAPECYAPIHALRLLGEPIIARSSALFALTYVTSVVPETRDALIAELRERLATTEDKAFASYLAIALGNLGVKDAYAEIMALYRAGRIDQEIIPAGAVRQLLLTDGAKRLACAIHPLWERYDQHGPFPEEREA